MLKIRTRLPAWGDWLYTAWQSFPLLRLIVTMLLLIGGGWLIMANWHLALAPETTTRLIERFWIIVGLGLWFGAINLQKRWPRPVLFARGRDYIPTLFPFAVFGVACVVYLTLRLNPDLTFLGYQSLNRLPPHRNEQLLLLLGGALCFVIGLMHPQELHRLATGLWTSLHQQRGEWLIAFTLTLIGLAVRLYRLDELIPIAVSDEPPFMYHARRIMEGRPISLAADMFYAQNYLGAMLTSFALEIFGVNLFAPRFVVAVMGTLAIPGVYLMARRLMSPTAAALAAMFLIAQPVHVFFSRTVLYNIYDPTIVIYAVLLLWHGLEHGGRWKFGLAGVLIGLSLYFYTASRLWLIVIPLWLLICFVRQPNLLRQHWQHGIVLIAGLALVLFPMLALIYQDEYSPTYNAVNMSKGEGEIAGVLDVTPRQYLYEWLHPAVRALIDRGDSSLHYEMFPHTAMHLLFAFLAFGLGLMVGLRYALHPYILFLLLWIGLAVFFGASLTVYVGFTRLLTAILPMAILASLGLDWLAQTLAPRLSRATAYSTVFLLMLAINMQDAKFILETHPRRYLNEVWIERWIADSLAQATLAVPRDEPTKIYWIASRYAWNLRMMQLYGYYNGWIDYELYEQSVDRAWIATLDNREHDLYIFVPPTPGDSPLASTPPAPDSPIWILSEYFPEGTWQRYDGTHYPTDRPTALYSLFYVPRGSPNLAQP